MRYTSTHNTLHLVHTVAIQINNVLIVLIGDDRIRYIIIILNLILSANYLQRIKSQQCEVCVINRLISMNIKAVNTML